MLILCYAITISTLYSQSENLLKCGLYGTVVKNTKSNINESLKFWFDVLKRTSKIKWVANSVPVDKYYYSKSSLVADIERGEIDYLMISGVDYFELDLRSSLIPFMVASKSFENKYDKYLLITNKRSEFNSITEIRNAQISVPISNFSGLMKIWLKVATLTKSAQRAGDKIDIIDVRKPENELLFSIFFNRLDLVIVREASYLFACEMNPQLKKSLKIIGTSQNLVSYLFSYRKGVSKSLVDDIVSEALRLHEKLKESRC